MSATELTREQLLDYVKKQKLKIKKLEAELSTVKSSSSTSDDLDERVAVLHRENEDLRNQLASGEKSEIGNDSKVGGGNESLVIVLPAEIEKLERQLQTQAEENEAEIAKLSKSLAIGQLRLRY
jgi:hypothetical protein